MQGFGKTGAVTAALLAISALAITMSPMGGARGEEPGWIGDAPDGRPMYIWDPGESYADGSQPDPRLDRPVVFWQAGAPLREVFAAIEEQTGVEFGFFPPDDENERVCVTLYLNPESPPSLRQLMVQLSWVIDCRFAFAKEADEEPSYHLLSTSIGAGAMSRVHGEVNAHIAALEDGVDPLMETAAQVRENMLSRMGELEAALSLTREEAIKRYKGKDDCLLLAALDPLRRPLGQFVATLGEEQLGRIRGEITIGVRLSDLAPEQRDYLREALAVRAPEWQKITEAIPERVAGQHWDDWAWVEEFDPEVSISTGDPTGFSVHLRGPDVADEHGALHISGLTLAHLQLVVDPRWAPSMRTASQVALRRALGEEVSEEEASRMWEERREERERREKRNQVKADFAEPISLSGEAQALLSSVTLPLRLSEACALWQVQEAAASLSGLHVVSDCLFQPARSLEEDLHALYPDRVPDLTALLGLKLMCMHRQDPHGFPRVGRKGWEWGDARTFLRFRSEERDLWRAALLPADVQAGVDGWIEPHLPETPQADSIRIPIDPRGCAWLVEHTTGTQRAWGGRLIYGDPTDHRNAYRHAFRDDLFGMLRQIPHIYRLIGTLSDEQWEQLHGRGLTWGSDFSPPVTQEDRNHGFWMDRERGDILRLVEPEPEILSAARERFGHIDLLGFFVFRDGEPIDGDGLLLTAVVRPEIPASLAQEEPAARGEAR